MEHTEGKVAVTHSHKDRHINPSYQLHQKGYENDCSVMRANSNRIEALWNAFNGINTHDALNIIQIGLSMKDNPDDIKYLEHGAEMERSLKVHCDACYIRNDMICNRSDTLCSTGNSLTKLGVAE